MIGTSGTTILFLDYESEIASVTSIHIDDQQPVFQQQGDLLLPTTLAQGPWYPGTAHGSAMLLMAALAVERLEFQQPMQVVRLTVDMMKAAPIDAIELNTEVRKSGRYMTVVDISICCKGEEYVRASALCFRTSEVPVIDRLKYQGPTFTLPGPLPADYFEVSARRPGFHHALDIQLDVDTKPALIWIRLKQPLLPDFEVTPLLRVALAADWTYSVPAMAQRLLTGEAFDSQPFYGINPDTTLNLQRPAQGEWIGIQTHATFDDLGAGTAVGQIFDKDGAVGFCSQSVLIRPRKA